MGGFSLTLLRKQALCSTWIWICHLLRLCGSARVGGDTHDDMRLIGALTSFFLGLVLLFIVAPYLIITVETNAACEGEAFFDIDANVKTIDNCEYSSSRDGELVHADGTRRSAHGGVSGEASPAAFFFFSYSIFCTYKIINFAVDQLI